MAPIKHSLSTCSTFLRRLAGKLDLPSATEVKAKATHLLKLGMVHPMSQYADGFECVWGETEEDSKKKCTIEVTLEEGQLTIVLAISPKAHNTAEQRQVIGRTHIWVPIRSSRPANFA